MIDYLIFKLFGFKSDSAFPFYHRYERDDEYGFTHVIDLCHKKSGKHIIQSYSLEDGNTQGNLCVGFDLRLLFLLWLKSVTLRLRWRCGNRQIKKTLRLNNCLGKRELGFGSMYTNDIKDEEHEPVVGNVYLKKVIIDAFLSAIEKEKQDGTRD